MRRFEGLILKLQALREADEIVHVLTPDEGYFRVRAPGVRRPGAKHRGALTAFSYVEFRTVTGKGLPIMVDAEVTSRVSGENFEKIYVMQKICALISRLIPEHTPDPLLWSLIQECYAAVLNSRRPLGEELVSAFVFKYLYLHGMQPELRQCMVCGRAIIPEEGITFSRIKGGVVDVACMSDVEAGISLDHTALRALSHMREAAFSEIIGDGLLECRPAKAVVEEFAKWHLGISISTYTI